jgi:hypothetical protein
MAQQINGPTVIAGVKTGKKRYRYEATANGVTGTVSTRSQATVRAEPVAINGKVGLVFKDARGDVIRYVLREC